MNVLELKKDFYWIGVQDPELRVFDIIMETEFGTTYNSYLLKTDKGVVLFETVKDRFFDEYLEKILELTTIDDIKYIVCSHTEPDHSGSISKLLDMNQHISVISSFAANRNLNEIVNENFSSLIVKDGEKLKLGDKTLQFLSVPNLHWPDTIYTYIEEDKILVTCDSYGAHYASDEILLSKVSDRHNYNKAFVYYTTMIMGPFKHFIKLAVDKIKVLDIDMIAPGHGLVIDQKEDVLAKIHEYEVYSKVQVNAKKKVVIPYVSAYGYTKRMAEIIQEEFTKFDVFCEIYDLVEANEAEVVSKMMAADAILYGSPTILNDALPPIYNVMNQIIAGYHGKKMVSAFGSYGWSGEAVNNLIVRLKQQKMDVIDEGLRIVFKPSHEQELQVRLYTRNFVKRLVPPCTACDAK